MRRRLLREGTVVQRHTTERAECFGEMTKSWVKWGHRGPRGDESKWGSVMEGLRYIKGGCTFPLGMGPTGGRSGSEH